MAQQVKNLPANGGDVGSIPGLGRYPGEGNGNPLQYSSLDNPMIEEPGRLQSWDLKRVGYSLSSKKQLLHLCAQTLVVSVSSGELSGPSQTTSILSFALQIS